MKPTEDDDELAKAYCAREPIIIEEGMNQGERWQAIARLIAEVRTEQRDFDADICEQYAEDTTFVRKAMAAQEVRQADPGTCTADSASADTEQEKK